jgi:ubiquinone/menaquinone biosynthesis C-methylase UbiE
MTPALSPDDPARYWDDRYQRVGDVHVSWFQARPDISLELIDSLGIGPSTPVLDVGGGNSRFVDELVARGFDDVTVLDVSSHSLHLSRRRLDTPDVVTWLHADVLTWRPQRRWGLWHDRALFHFLTDAADRAMYLDNLERALQPGGSFVIGTFAPDGPHHCSGLPVSRYDGTALGDTVLAAIPGATITAWRAETHLTPSGAVQPFTWIAGAV